MNVTVFFSTDTIAIIYKVFNFNVFFLKLSIIIYLYSCIINNCLSHIKNYMVLKFPQILRQRDKVTDYIVFGNTMPHKTFK